MRAPLLLPSLLLTITLQAQVSNGGFETTVITEGDTLPEDWALPSTFGAGIVDGGHSGEHALGVWNWYWYAEGMAVNGISYVQGYEGTPISGHPTLLSGWYRRDLGIMNANTVDDRAYVRVFLTRWNAQIQARDTVALGEEFFTERSQWSPFTVDIGYLSAEAPDTVVVQIASCVDCLCDGPSQGYCAYFYVDDLQLSFAQGVDEPLFTEGSVRLLPQGDGTVRVDVAEHIPLPFRLNVWDAIGRSLAEVNVRTNGQRITVPGAAGVIAFRASANGQPIQAGRVLMP